MSRPYGTNQPPTGLRPSPPAAPPPRRLNAYELPRGTEIVIGKRRWMLVDFMRQHPDVMHFTETTGEEPDPMKRAMYPSEVQALIDAGFEVKTGGQVEPHRR